MSSLLQPTVNKGKENTQHSIPRNKFAIVAGRCNKEHVQRRDDLELGLYKDSPKVSSVPDKGQSGASLTIRRTNFYSTPSNASKKKFEVCPQPSLNRSSPGSNKGSPMSFVPQSRVDTPASKPSRTLPNILRSAPVKRSSPVKPSNAPNNGALSDDDDFCESSKCNGNAGNGFPTYVSFRNTIYNNAASTKSSTPSTTKSVTRKRTTLNPDDIELEETSNDPKILPRPSKGPGNSSPLSKMNDPNRRKPLEDVRSSSQLTQNGPGAVTSSSNGLPLSNLNGTNHRKPLEDVEPTPQLNKNYSNITYSKSSKSNGNVSIPQNVLGTQSVQKILSSPQSYSNKRFKPTHREENKENNMAIREDSDMFGLNNLGNSCYMNSAMQSLLGLDMLVHDLLALRAKASNVQWSDLFESVCMLMVAKVSSRERNFSQIGTIIRKLRDSVTTKFTQLTPGRMQDSAEFLALLIEGLKTEIAAKMDKDILQDPFCNNFDFTILTTTHCTKCNAFEPDPVKKYILQVTAPTDDVNHNTKSIQDVIDDYFVPKEIRAFTCSKCNFQHDRILPTSVQVSGLPRILIVEMSRCFYVGVNAFKSSKPLLIQKFISLKNVASDAVPPVAYQHTNSEFSELSEICYNGVFTNGALNQSRNEDIFKDVNDQEYDQDLQQALRLSEEDNISKSQEFEDNVSSTNPTDASLDLDISHALTDTAETSPCAYQLVSIISHIGSEITSGHYVSDVYNMSRRCWSHCSDLSVQSIAEKEVLLSCQASGSIFFYVHRDLLPTRV